MKIAILDVNESARDLTLEVLKDLGYRSIEVFEKFKDFQKALVDTKFDLIISDYLLDGGKTAKDLLESKLGSKTKCIIRTAYFDQAIFDTLKMIRPFIFLPKGESSLDLIQSINYLNHSEIKVPSDKRKITSCFYIKLGDRHRQIFLNDVYYFEVDGKYLNVICKNKKYIMRSALSEIQQRIEGKFVRVHSAYLVNINKIESFKLSDNTLDLNGFSVPLSRKYKPELLEAIIVT